MSHREYLTRLAWLDSQWNKPDRSDYYAMQIASEVRRWTSKNPNKVTIEQMKLPFQTQIGKEQREEELAQLKMENSKAVWKAFARRSRPVDQ